MSEVLVIVILLWLLEIYGLTSSTHYKINKLIKVHHTHKPIQIKTFILIAIHHRNNQLILFALRCLLQMLQLLVDLLLKVFLTILLQFRILQIRMQIFQSLKQILLGPLIFSINFKIWIKIYHKVKISLKYNG